MLTGAPRARWSGRKALPQTAVVMTFGPRAGRGSWMLPRPRGPEARPGYRRRTTRWSSAIVSPEDRRWRVSNDDAGVSALVTASVLLAPACVIVEATGGYETAMVTTLALAGVPVAVVNPRQVRDFAKGLQRLAKTDAIDAWVLARFGEVTRPAPRPLDDAATLDLSALVHRRRQLVEMLVAEKNRRSVARPAWRYGGGSRSTSPGWRGKWRRPTRRLPRAFGRVLSGASANSCYAASRASGPAPRASCSRGCRNWGTPLPANWLRSARFVPFNADSGRWRGQRRYLGRARRYPRGT